VVIKLKWLNLDYTSYQLVSRPNVTFLVTTKSNIPRVDFVFTTKRIGRL